MGRRSRKRASRPAPAPSPAEPARPERSARRRRPRPDERPPAPWGALPLVELSVLVALGLGIGGFVVGGRRGGVMLACAAALGSLAGLEISIREHFAGYRSHTTVLAAAPAILTMAILFFTRAPRGAMLGAGVVVFGTAFYLLREVFKRRSGGFGFR